MKKRVVTVMVPAMASSIRDIVRGVADHATAQNWHLVLHLWGQVSSTDVASINEGDGVIFESPLGSSLVKNPVWTIPAVAVQIPRLAEHYPLVTTDYREVGRRAGEYLIRKGLTRLAYISYARGDLAEGGLRAVALDAGRSLSTYYLGPQKPELNAQDQQQLLEWLAALPPPVGILMQSDFMAQKIMDWIPAEWMPERLAVLGVGDDSIICPMTRPNLSSIDRNAREIGRSAASLLERIMDGETIEPQTFYLEPGQVIERQSTGLSYTPDPLVTRAIRLLEADLANAPTADALCARLQVSRSTLENRFRDTLGHSIWKQRRYLQIEHAKYLLATTGESMSSIAERCGFANQQYLTQAFRKDVGVTPSRYRSGQRKR